MKRHLYILLSLTVAISACAQGNLTPTAPPGPTMKTLDQVEARIIVNAANAPGDTTNTLIISQPGSYYLIGNITGASGKHGISIRANDVTLDLNGFALIGGGGGAFIGVTGTAAQTNFCIRNGTVRGWTGGGVRTDTFISTLAEKLRLSDNVGAWGLSLGNGVARDCVASGNGTGFVVGNGAMITGSSASANTTGFIAGDRAQVSHCISTINTGVGFDCTSYVTLIDCTASRNFGSAGIVALSSTTVSRCSATRNLPSGNGIVAGPTCTIVDCTVGSNGNDGITEGSGSAVRGCTTSNNQGNGIKVTSDCYVIGNTCEANNRSGFNYAGISVSGHGNRIEANSVTATDNPSGGFSNGYGFYVTDSQTGTPATNNFIIRNSARDNGTNYRIDAGNRVGAILLPAGSIAISGNSGGGLGTTDPWANFVY
ncbi:MAG: right-handed parallel beta-helix repeat-containing protein [Verrucomicrobiota bacterium]|nr:right-handed parallel beta-helix repeat-containing protein [Verrucomicrobiota bacterium]